MALKAILFDLDGTLIDSTEWHLRSFQQLWKLFGKKLSRKKISPLIRWSTEDVYFKLNVKKYFGIDLEKFIQLRRQIFYAQIQHKSLAFPNAISLVKKVKKNRKVALVTNSSRITTVHSAPKALLRLFSVIITYDDVLHGKPNPEPLLKACKKLRVSPRDAIMVGDSTLDLLAAKRAKMRAIAVCGGSSPRKELQKLKPLKVCRNLKEVQKFLLD
ncbi:MAG: HAD family hydrolase [Candidatus Diapherotrites archaeon]